jgi:methyl-accepting chemotaxis protein
MAINAAVQQIQQELSARVESERRTGARRQWLLLGLAAATLALLALTLRHIVRTITNPIAMAVQAAERVTAGDLTGDVRINCCDEIGELQQALLRMHVALSDIVADVRRGSTTIEYASQDIAQGTRTSRGAPNSRPRTWRASPRARRSCKPQWRRIPRCPRQPARSPRAPAA